MPLTTDNLFNIRATVELEFEDTLQFLTERTLQISWVKKLLQALREQSFRIPSTTEATDGPRMATTFEAYRDPRSSFRVLNIPEAQVADARMVIRLTLYQLITAYSRKYSAFQVDVEFCAELNLTKQYFQQALQTIPGSLLPPLVMAPMLDRQSRLIIDDRLNRWEVFLNQSADKAFFLLMGLIAAVIVDAIMPRSDTKDDLWSKYKFIATSLAFATFCFYKTRPYVAECLFFSVRRRGVTPVQAVSHSEARRIGVLTP